MYENIRYAQFLFHNSPYLINIRKYQMNPTVIQRKHFP